MGENLDTQSQLDKTSENAPDQIILDEQDLEKVKRITSGVNVVPEEIRDKAKVGFILSEKWEEVKRKSDDLNSFKLTHNRDVAKNCFE